MEVNHSIKMESCEGCNGSLRRPPKSNLNTRTITIVESLGKKWHGECLLCSSEDCQLNLVGKPFRTKDGKHYCEEHYFELFGHRCCACQEIVKSDHCVRALDKHWHTECFKCTSCQAPLYDVSNETKSRKEEKQSEFFVRDGLPYCKRDYTHLFMYECMGCHNLIESGRKVKALEGDWHESCFTCQVCQKELANPQQNKSLQFFPVHNSDGTTTAVCGGCHYTSRGLKCASCDLLITESEETPIQACGQHWHLNCFSCSLCHAAIFQKGSRNSGDFYMLHRDLERRRRYRSSISKRHHSVSSEVRNSQSSNLQEELLAPEDKNTRVVCPKCYWDQKRSMAVGLSPSRSFCLVEAHGLHGQAPSIVCHICGGPADDSTRRSVSPTHAQLPTCRDCRLGDEDDDESVADLVTLWASYHNSVQNSESFSAMLQQLLAPPPINNDEESSLSDLDDLDSNPDLDFECSLGSSRNIHKWEDSIDTSRSSSSTISPRAVTVGLNRTSVGKPRASIDSDGLSAGDLENDQDRKVWKGKDSQKALSKAHDGSQTVRATAALGKKVGNPENNKSRGTGLLNKAQKWVVQMMTVSPSDISDGPASIIYSDIKFVRQLGEGAFGTVYEATWKGHRVAVKSMRLQHTRNPVYVNRFKAEIGIMSRLDHPNS